MLTEEQAFLEAIVANPKDVGPRLMFADWLEENAAEVLCEACYDTEDHGPSGWGNYRKSSCPRCDGRGYVSDGRRERGDFIRESLADPHGGNYTASPSMVREYRPHAWSEAFACMGEQWTVQVRRGFVEAVSCTAGEWLAHAEELVKAAPIREVALTTHPHRRFDWDRGVWQLMDRKMWHPFDMNADVGVQVASLLAAEWPGVSFRLPNAER